MKRLFVWFLIASFTLLPCSSYGAGRTMAVGPQLVASGSVTQANMRISAVDGGSTASGGAFIDFTAANVLTSKIGNLLIISDSAGRKIQGYIKSAGTSEGLGTNLITAFPSGYGASGGYVSATANTITTNADGGLFKTAGVSLGQLVKYTFTGSTTATNVTLKNASDTSFPEINSGSVGYGTLARSADGPFVKNYGSGTATLASSFFGSITSPSATGVTITSTKGGATYNWAAKNTAFNYNDGSGYTYQIFKVNALVDTGFGGAVTAANEHASLVAGTAFYFSDALNFTPYQDGRHYLRLTDTAGVVAWGKIKAEVPGGETLGSEICTDPGFDDNTKWDTVSGFNVSGGKLTVTASALAIYNNGNLYATLKLFKFTYVVDSLTSGQVTTRIAGCSDGTPRVAAGTYSDYIVGNGTDPRAGIRGVAGQAFTGVVDSFSGKQVLAPPATGAIIVNAAGTQNFINVGTGFNGNSITSLKVYYGD